MAVSKKKIEKIIELIFEKKGDEVLLLELKKRSPITDYFIICTAQSPLHAQAICQELETRLKKENIRPHHVEGYQNGQWVILDYWDFIVHIFLAEVRQFYGLERLWGDAPQTRYHDQPANH
ncbi:MAG: ribosome silencing factor [Candidatus Latescibacteria bacterium]|nr:ribosome silencing factor [Candidatus Latescibacterota bacterium]